MGWWSCDILGGDEPYDIRDALIEKFQDEPDFWFEKKSKEEYRALLNASLDDVVNEARNYADCEDPNIPGQVLGYIIMELGANMPDDVREFVLESATNDLWAAEDGERKTFIDNFIKQVKAYVPGQPVDFEHIALMDVLAAKLTQEDEE